MVFILLTVTHIELLAGNSWTIRWTELMDLDQSKDALKGPFVIDRKKIDRR